MTLAEAGKKIEKCFVLLREIERDRDLPPDLRAESEALKDMVAAVGLLAMAEKKVAWRDRLNGRVHFEDGTELRVRPTFKMP